MILIFKELMDLIFDPTFFLITPKVNFIDTHVWIDTHIFETVSIGLHIQESFSQMCRPVDIIHPVLKKNSASNVLSNNK